MHHIRTSHKAQHTYVIHYMLHKIQCIYSYKAQTYSTTPCIYPHKTTCMLCTHFKYYTILILSLHHTLHPHITHVYLLPHLYYPNGTHTHSSTFTSHISHDTPHWTQYIQPTFTGNPIPQIQTSCMHPQQLLFYPTNTTHSPYTHAIFSRCVSYIIPSPLLYALPHSLWTLENTHHTTHTMLHISKIQNII